MRPRSRHMSLSVFGRVGLLPFRPLSRSGPASAAALKVARPGLRFYAAISPSALPRFPLFDAIARHDPASLATVDAPSGHGFTYRQLLSDVRRARNRMLETHNVDDLAGHRVAILVEKSYDYVVTLLAVIAARATAVPLAPDYPDSELRHILDDSDASLIVSTPSLSAQARKLIEPPPPSELQDSRALQTKAMPKHLKLAKHQTGVPGDHVELQAIDEGDAAIMLYTSGTTSRPKGVLLPQSTITAQIRSLIEAWKFSSADCLLHVLPLHHIHGVVNALLTPLFAGSTVELLSPFNDVAVWRRLRAPFPHPNNPDFSDHRRKITLLTAVPTIYSSLVKCFRHLPHPQQEAARQAVSPRYMRLAMSGSAALPTNLKEAWEQVSGGSLLLERYGMTEIGMALSCGLAPADRIEASVGWPLPSVEVRLVDLDSGAVIPPDEVTADGREHPGEIQVRGPTVFRQYWRNQEATARDFVPDPQGGSPWFKTGDVAVRRPVPNAGRNTGAQPWTAGHPYFILGRKSLDIFKSRGERISAYEIEHQIRSLPVVSEVAVLALPSPSLGHKIVAVVVLDPTADKDLSIRSMRRALIRRLAKHKLPEELRLVDKLPYNVMGKVNKRQLFKDLFPDKHE